MRRMSKPETIFGNMNKDSHNLISDGTEGNRCRFEDWIAITHLTPFGTFSVLLILKRLSFYALLHYF